MMQLLRQLLDSLSTTLRAFKRFEAKDGDYEYFSDASSKLAPVHRSIRDIFEKMTDVFLRLSSLNDSCERFATHVSK
jgi:hypothetical protein